MESITNLLANPPKKRTEKRICVNCNTQFDAVIYVLKDRELDVNTLCAKCEKDKKAQEEREAYQAKLDEKRTDEREHWIKVYGLTGSLKEKTFENFNAKLQPAAFKALKEYNGKSLVLLSPEIYGVGKTHLVAALANYLVQTTEPAAFDPGSYHIRTKVCPVHFTVETSLLARIRDTFNRGFDQAGETEEMVYRLINSFPLLIIDDVGKVKPRDLSFLQSVYFRIIDERVVSRKQIILTTNLDGAGLGNHIGGACLDRLYEMAGPSGFITLKGKSYRQRQGTE